MKGQLDQKWIMKVAEELEPIFKFMNHSWKEALKPPTAAEIAKEINILWASLRKDDVETSSGGIHISIDGEDQPVITYSKEITFEYNAGDFFSV